MTGGSAAVHTVKLHGYAYGGEAFGRLPDQRIVFVPYALPGETVNVRLLEEKRGHARGQLLEVLLPAADRVTPFCQHYGVCGGCHYQHLRYPAQLEARSAVLRDQLMRLGGLADPPVLPTVPCPQPRQYRNHVQFHLAPGGKLGYHQAHSDVVFPIQECHLPEQALQEIWPQLEFETLPGLERIGLRSGLEGEAQLILESNDPELPEVFVEELPLSVVHVSPAGMLVLAGSEWIEMEVLGKPFRVSAGSFFQVNSVMAGKMVEHILERLPHYAPLSAKTILVDAYCGVGLFSAFLAPLVGHLIGIEASTSAADDFVANLDAFDHVDLYEAEVEAVLAGLDVKPDVVLLDPPRAGLGSAALEALLTLETPLVVYISCDPATLARDSRRLVSGGYSLCEITPFDLFPQTYHIESISFWLRKNH